MEKMFEFVIPLISIIISGVVSFILFKAKQHEKQYQALVDKKDKDTEEKIKVLDDKLQEVEKKFYESKGNLQGQMNGIEKTLTEQFHKLQLENERTMTSIKDTVIQAINDLKLYSIEHFMTKGECRIKMKDSEE